MTRGSPQVNAPVPSHSFTWAHLESGAFSTLARQTPPFPSTGCLGAQPAQVGSLNCLGTRLQPAKQPFMVSPWRATQTWLSTVLLFLFLGLHGLFWNLIAQFTSLESDHTILQIKTNLLTLAYETLVIWPLLIFLDFFRPIKYSRPAHLCTFYWECLFPSL